MKNRLKVARAEIALTQEELAKRIGVSRQTINAVESGRYVPSTVLALKMSQCSGNRWRRFSSWKKRIDVSRRNRRNRRSLSDAD